MPQRVAAVLPALNRARAVVLARVEQDREQAEALLDLEAPEAAEPALGEVDHRLAQQNSRSSRCAIIFIAKHFHMWDLDELTQLGEVSQIQYGSCAGYAEPD
jgi:hypothetical protein